MSSVIDQYRPHPAFGAALAALDAGDLDRLRHLVSEYPSLLHARTNLDPRHGYFTMAEGCGAHGIARLLEAHGATRKAGPRA